MGVTKQGQMICDCCRSEIVPRNELMCWDCKTKSRAYLDKIKEINVELLRLCIDSLEWHKTDKWRKGTMAQKIEWIKHRNLLEKTIAKARKVK